MKTICSYQGSKSKYSEKIVQLINPKNDSHVVDMCCGSGAITLELLERVDHVTMIDKGSWGLFWKEIENGFDLDRLRKVMDRLPSERSLEKDYLLSIAETEADIYKWVILQAASFGGKEVSIVNGKFTHHGFRPFKIYNNNGRQYHTIYPNPQELFSRIVSISKIRSRVKAIVDDVMNYLPEEGDIGYIDPPYTGTTGYTNGFDLHRLVEKWGRNTLFASEGNPLVGAFAVHKLDDRKKTSLSVKNKNNRSEYVSEFR